MNGDPTRGDAGDGYRHDGKRVERRSGEERREGWFVTCVEFKWWKRRATAAFVLLTAASVLSGYLGYTAGQSSDANLRTSGADAVLRSCLSRADIRLTTAEALDGLRAAALRPPVGPAEEREQTEFLARTQGPINDLLSRAAGRELRTVGRLRESFLAELRVVAAKRCVAAAMKQFEGVRLDAAPDG